MGGREVFQNLVELQVVSQMVVVLVVYRVAPRVDPLEVVLLVARVVD